MKPARRPDQGEGFSLLEILVVLAIMALLAAVSAPPLARLLDSAEFRSRTDGAARDISQIRVAAFLQGRPFVFAPDAPEAAPVDSIREMAAQGWLFRGDPIAASTAGVCSGGEITMVAPNGRAATFVFTAPDCDYAAPP